MERSTPPASSRAAAPAGTDLPREVAAAPSGALTYQERWRRRRLRQIGLLVTLPGLILGTVTVSAAYSSGLMDAKPAAACQPVLTPAPAKSGFRVQVLNGTGTDGVATVVGREMSQRGFRVSGSANAPESLLVRESARVFHGPDSLDEALLVASQVPGATLFDDGRAGKDLDLALGLRYRALVPVPPRAAPLPRSITVDVWNTTYHEGLAKRVQDDLAGRGFRKGKSGNDPQRTWQRGVGVVRHGPDGLRQAKVLARSIPGVTLQQVSRTGTGLELVLGARYAALAPIASIPVPPPVSLSDKPVVARPCSTDS